MKKTLNKQKIINFISNRNTGKIGEYTMCEGGEITLYSSCFAAMALHYLNSLSKFSHEEKREWSEYINSWQDKETGFYVGPEVVKEELTSPMHNYEHTVLYLTVMALPTVLLLNTSPKYQLYFYHRFLDKVELLRWLEARDWKNAWLEGNNLFFIGQILIYLRDYEGFKDASKSLDLYFDWLDSQVDPKTGLWGTNGYCSPFVAMCGGYHELLAYYYENREVKHKQKLVDTVLSLQHPDGGFHPKGGGGACEALDAADILVNMYKQIDYRRSEIRIALRRLLKSILKKQMPDGGFVYRINERFILQGILKSRSPANISNIFATWVRVHTIALISQVLTDETIIQLDWQFNDTCSVGWHKPWDRSKHTLSWLCRQDERLSCLVSDLSWGMQAAHGKVRRLGARVKRRLLRGIMHT